LEPAFISPGKNPDRGTALLASTNFAIDIDRNSQAAFAMFEGQKHHEDALIRKAQEYIGERSRIR